MPWVVDSEAKRVFPPVREVGHDGVVGVHDERRFRRERRRRRPPALRYELELAVPVELVAKEVAEHDAARARALDRLGERALVDLEQAQVCVLPGEEGGPDAGEEV